MIESGLMLEKKMVEGKPALMFTVQFVSKTSGLLEAIEAVGFKYIKCEDMACLTVTKRDDAITDVLGQYFNKDGTAK